MFVDQAEIAIKAGKGGNGAVSFRREKYVPDGGPDGGTGGKGGNVVVKVDMGMRTLMDFRYKSLYKAEAGENGQKKKMSGKKGEDLVILLPPGTLIRDKETGKIIADLKGPEDEVVIARGGNGGKGNAEFKTSTRRAPSFSQQGFYGQERQVILELKMLADVGLVGFPNVGKSTILSKVTKAKPKIADYHFTTLFPNLGVVEVVRGKSFVLADIPGLIEGAHKGVGLGHDFLRHIERTKLILHVVDISGIEGRDPLEDFNSINEELKAYSEKLFGRHQIVAANKMDLLSDEGRFLDFKKQVEELGYECFGVSGATGEGVEVLMKAVTNALEGVEELPLYDTSDWYDPENMAVDIQEVKYWIEDGVYCLEGMAVERLYFSTNFSDLESLRRFQNILLKKGVFEELVKMGIEDGDTVRIYDLEFEYYE